MKHAEWVAQALLELPLCHGLLPPSEPVAKHANPQPDVWSHLDPVAAQPIPG